jgi:tetratricopeptide (TPR) repeat protein
VSTRGSALPDLLGRAEAAYELAVSDPTAAGPVADLLVLEARRVGDTESAIVALRALAWAERSHLAAERAKQLLDEAASLAKNAGLDERLGEVLVVRSAVNQELGKARAAQRDLDAARPLLGAAGLAELQHHSAVVHQNAGRLREAAAIYRRVLASLDCPDVIRAKDCNNLAMILADFGRYAEALDLTRQALALAEEVGPALTAYFAEGQARVLAQAGMLAAGLEGFERAERLYEKAGLPRAELYTEFADLMTDLGLLPEALAAARRGREEFDANNILLMGAEAALRVARLALVTGDPAAAEEAAAAAAKALRHQGRGGWAAAADVLGVQARHNAGEVSMADLGRARRAAAVLERMAMTPVAVDAHLLAARLELGLDRRSWALQSLERAAALARHSSVLIRLKGNTAVATAALLEHDPGRLLRACRAGLRDLREHRDALSSIELRVLASAHGVELGAIGLRALLSNGSPADVLRWMERTRAAALLSIRRTPVDAYDAELAELHAIEMTMRTNGALSTQEAARQRMLEGRIRRLSWGAGAEGSTSDASAPLQTVRDLLGGRILVEYGVVDDSVFAVVQTRTRATIRQLGSLALVQEELDRLLFALRSLARSIPDAVADRLRSVAVQRIQRLRQRLVDPLGVGAGTALVLVPVGVLQRVPWSALHDGPVSLVPSAAFWSRARQRPAPDAHGVLLVAGPDVPHATAEVRRLAENHRGATVLLPPKSTVAHTAEALSGVELAHFACHGLMRADNPMFSGLALSDGLLTVQELDLRGAAPRRVVLAACQAAADLAYPGGESLGFVSALLARGTAGMVASIIEVPDASASRLMIDLHRQLARSSLDVALYEARERLNTSDPMEFVNWCGFAAFGAC